MTSIPLKGNASLVRDLSGLQIKNLLYW